MGVRPYHVEKDAIDGSYHIIDGSTPFAKLKKAFGTEISVSVAAGGTSTVAKGVYLVSLGANTSVQYYSAAAGAWRTCIPAGHGGLIVSDGANVRLYNAGTAAETSYLLPLV